MKNIILKTLTISMLLLVSCDKSGRFSQVIIEGIVLYNHDSYIDDTLIEGGPDYYINITKTIFAENIGKTETLNESWNLPVSFYDDVLPLYISNDEFDNSFNFDIYDDDPSDDDYIGSISWIPNWTVGTPSEYVISSDDNEIGLLLNWIE